MTEENKCKNEECEGHGLSCDYVLEGYADECCICGEYEIHQRCADQISDMADRAYENYKDNLLRKQITFETIEKIFRGK